MPSDTRLREIQAIELPLMLTWRNSPEVRANMYTRHEISIDEHLAWWAGIQGRGDVRYHMFESAGRPLGIVGFTRIDQTNGNASWAFYAAPNAPRGTGSQMEFLALEHAFGPMGLHKLYCEVLDFNQPVVRLHEKFGFRIEGTLREHHRLDASHVGIVQLGILAQEWQQMRADMAKRIQRSMEPRSPS